MEIAQGNLNVTIEEDLGVFEPFKPQIYRIGGRLPQCGGGGSEEPADEVGTDHECIPRSEDATDSYHYLCKAATGAGSDGRTEERVLRDVGS